jgi:WD40 repeat protein/energy-coupling factor transporter ATP-binding protein EcfA2
MSSTLAINTKISNPFPGLRAFHMDESHLFFGREGQTDEVLMKLSDHRFVGVIGPSGSGKSSFVYCGVLPILYGGFMANAGPNWDVIVARPGNNPIGNLAEAILEQDPEYINAEDADRKVKKTILTTLMKSSSLGLVEAIKQVKKVTNKNYLILIDQFEELFRFKDSETSDASSLNETLSFINLLMQGINNEETPIYVTITMRSDFIGECAQFAELTKKINDSHYLIPQLTRDQKRRAIEGPVAVGGGEIAPRLVQRLLNDLGDNPDQLPILQHSLMRTWDFWTNNREGDEIVDLKHYEAIGTMSEALSMHANEAYDELTDEQRFICGVLFKTITEKRGESFGIRRPTRLGEIAAIADVSVEEVAEVIEKFREPGRSLLMPPVGKPLEDGTMIDISHESLMRIWVRLKNWVDEEAESINMYMRLAEAASMHQAGKGGLWRPPDLQLALNWQIKHKPTLVWGQRYDSAYERTMVFLEYSKKAFEEEQKIKELQAKKALRTARITSIVLGSAAVVSIMFLIYAFAQNTIAKQATADMEIEKIKAEEASIQAQINADSAKAASKRAEQQREKAEQASIRAKLNEQKALVAEDSATNAAERAEIQRLRAEDQQRQAEAARERALEQEKIATEQKKLAEKSEKLATKERYLSLSKALALKSTGNFNDPQLKALLAMQGYKFNKDREGPIFNADVYAGIYAGLGAGGFNDISTQPLRGHDQQVNAVTTGSGSGEYIYSGDSRGKILHWEIDGLGNITADTIRRTQPGTHVIADLVMSPDDKYLLAAGDFREPETNEAFMEVIDLHNNNKVNKITGFSGSIKDIEVLDQTSRYFILSEGGRNIQEVDINTGTIIEFIKPETRINDLNISKDGRYMAGAGFNGTVYVWDLANNNTSLNYPSYPGAQLTSVRYSRDGKYLVAGELDGLIHLINTSTGKQERVFSDFREQVMDTKFSPDGNYMAVASRGREIRVWNMKNLNEQPYVLTLSSWVPSMAFSPDSRFLFGGGFKEGEVKVFPMNIEVMANKLCSLINRPLTEDEWEIYVGPITEESPYDPVKCPNR